MGNLADLAVTGITALAAGGRTGVVPVLGYGINRISVCATLGDSVQLPPAQAGQIVRVINKGAQSCQVFGNIANADTINGIATATGIAQAPGTSQDYICSVGEIQSGPSSSASTIVAGNWETFGSPGAALVTTTPLAASGAVNPHSAATYLVTKAGVAALTLAAPTTGVDDGVEIEINSNTANAHTLTATGLLNTGSANVNLATFAAFAGAGLKLRAQSAKWNVVYQVGITFS